MMQIYDNFFDTEKCSRIYSTLLNSYYKIGWTDSEEPQHRAYPNLHAKYSFEDIKNLKIIDTVLDKLKDKNITIDNYDTCIINLTKPLDVNFIHCHPNQIVFLHYSCLSWNPEWGGETIFYKDDKKNILEATAYVPNRAIIFDGNIPHTIKAQNILGPSYRFTTSIFFNKI